MRNLFAALEAALMDGDGVTSADERRSVARYCCAVARGENSDSPARGALAVWIDKVARYAYKTTTEEAQAVESEGRSQDAIFELTVAAAYGAALGRFEQAVAVIERGYKR